MFALFLHQDHTALPLLRYSQAWDALPDELRPLFIIALVCAAVYGMFSGYHKDKDS